MDRDREIRRLRAQLAGLESLRRTSSDGPGLDAQIFGLINEIEDLKRNVCPSCGRIEDLKFGPADDIWCPKCHGNLGFFD